MEILDCTIRDGGFKTEFEWSPEFVADHLAALTNQVNYIEVGFWQQGSHTYESLDSESIRQMGIKNSAVFANYHLQTAESIDDLLTSNVSLFRLSAKQHEITDAIALLQKVAVSGIRVSLQIQYFKTYKFYEIYEIVALLKDTGIDYVYAADSTGSIICFDNDDDARKLIALTSAKKHGLKVGFHGHNNLELALANSIFCIENGYDIIDATAGGIGKGVGNLKIELLFTYLDLPIDRLARHIIKHKESLCLPNDYEQKIAYMQTGKKTLHSSKHREILSRWGQSE